MTSVFGPMFEIEDFAADRNLKNNRKNFEFQGPMGQLDSKSQNFNYFY